MSVTVVSEINDTGRAGSRPLRVRRRLLEANSVIGDDMADAVLGYAVTGCGASKPHVGTIKVSNCVRHNLGDQFRERRFLSQVENGRRGVRWHTVMRLLRGLDMRVSDLGAEIDKQAEE
jgi:hypothetical protein